MSETHREIITDTSDVVASKSDSKNRNAPESAFSYYWGRLVSLDQRHIIISNNIRIYHHFAKGQENPPECKQFAVKYKACRVMDVLNL